MLRIIRHSMPLATTTCAGTLVVHSRFPSALVMTEVPLRPFNTALIILAVVHAPGDLTDSVAVTATPANTLTTCPRQGRTTTGRTALQPVVPQLVARHT